MGSVTIEFTDLDELKAAIIKEATPQIIKDLSVYAKTTLLDAYNRSTYSHNKSQNLADSYVWAVYNDNVLVKKGYLYPSPKAKTTMIETGTKRRVYGRKEADEFLASYKPNTNGFVVVFAARMYYGAYLEKGTRRNKTYVVLSSIWNEVSHDEDISLAAMAIDTHLY